MGNFKSVLTVGPAGPVLMEDHIFLETFQHHNRARTSERLFHARGTGCHGHFEVTKDITKYCAADFFSEVGKRTPIFTRFSMGLSQLGLAETSLRGIRGMAVKFYTQEGNYDLTMLGEPPFIHDDPLKQHSSTTAGQAHLVNNFNNLPDLNATWDFNSQTPSMCHFLLWQFQDTGFPDGYRHMDMFAVNTYKFINRHGESFFVKYHMLTDQGVKNLTPAEATRIAGENPDYSTQDLVKAIDRGDFPSWTMSVQVMTPDQANDTPFNPFDPTKLWPQKEFPLMEVGRLTMNRNVSSNWDETEQVAFNPGNFVPGIRASPDKVLNGRLFAYPDTQNFRVGVNRNQLPINRPLVPVANYQREGKGVYISQGAAPHYFPNSFGGPVESKRAQELEPSYRQCGTITRFEVDEDDHYTQPRELWRNGLDEGHRSRVARNIADELRVCTKGVQDRSIALFEKVDEDISDRLRKYLDDFKRE